MLRLYADMSQARSLLGYEPKVQLEEGLTMLLEWYRSQAASPEQLLQQEVVRNWDVNSIATNH